jgi:GntR family transcriptional regulator
MQVTKPELLDAGTARPRCSRGHVLTRPALGGQLPVQLGQGVGDHDVLRGGGRPPDRKEARWLHDSLSDECSALIPLCNWKTTTLRLRTSTYVELHIRPGTLIIVEPPKINPRAAEPPYRQIANWLRVRIEAGEFRPEIDPLPSEKELGELFEVARETARRAVAALREEGLVRTVPQRGTYVIGRN